jgi:FkbM family methyltransferase
MYYAEMDLDKHIRKKFFPDLSYKGIMVDVGAGPPTFINNSKHFRETGWRTISVEPNPKFVLQHKAENSEVYQYACANFDGVSEFTINLNSDGHYSEENDGVSFSAIELRINSYMEIPPHNKQQIITVDVITLNTLLQKLKIDHVDLLTIDVEGWELDVLEGFDQIKYNPKVIVLEILGNYNREKYLQFMKRIGFYVDSTIKDNTVFVNSNYK